MNTNNSILKINATEELLNEMDSLRILGGASVADGDTYIYCPIKHHDNCHFATSSCL